jgi:O-antigen ligase
MQSRSVLGRAGHSSEGRVHIWQSLLRRYVEKPLGIGPGNSAELQLSAEERERPDSMLSKEAHNDYLAYLIERGPLALLGLLILKLLALGKVVGWWRRRVSAGERSGGVLAAAALAALMASSAHSITLETMHFRHEWLFLALVCSMDGMVFHARRAERHSRSAAAPAGRRVAAVA